MSGHSTGIVCFVCLVGCSTGFEQLLHKKDVNYNQPFGRVQDHVIDQLKHLSYRFKIGIVWRFSLTLQSSKSPTSFSLQHHSKVELILMWESQHKLRSLIGSPHKYYLLLKTNLFLVWKGKSSISECSIETNLLKLYGGHTCPFFSFYKLRQLNP